MAVTGTVQLSAEIVTAYESDYIMAGISNMYWDQFAEPRQIDAGMKASTYQIPILESMQPSTGTLDELNDVTAQAMSANSVSVTMNEYGSAIEVTRLVGVQSYIDVYEQAAISNGYNMAESFDLIARAVAGQGSRRFFQNSRTARSAFLGKSTSADRITTAFIEMLATFARTSRMQLYEDNTVVCPLHPFVWYDLQQATDVRNLAQYQNPEILFNGEIAKWGGTRFILAANSKAFLSAGAADPTIPVATTLAAAAAVGATNLKLTDVTNVNVGKWINIVEGTESGNTWYDTNEMFFVTAVGTSGSGGTGVDGWAYDPGPGDNGGLRFAHASGTTVSNANNVYPLVVLGPKSFMKAYSGETGPYGESVVTGPFDRLGRFLTFGWYQIMGYTRLRNQWIMRGEVGSSFA